MKKTGVYLEVAMVTKCDFIDVSEHNKIKDWEQLKKSGDAVVMRAGYRGSIKGRSVYGKITFDAKFKEHLAGCRQYGIPYGIYFFPTAITTAEAREEGDWLVKLIKDMDLKLCLPVFLDSELVYDGAGRADQLSRADRTKFLNETMKVLKAAGIPFGVYASTSWFYDKLIDRELLAGTQRWVAQYATRCTYDGEYMAWQYTSKAKVPGVYKADGKTQQCDRSYCYVDLVKQEDEKKMTVEKAKAKVLTLAAAEVGYREKKSNSSLDSKTANAGSGNYTKYGKEMHSIQPSNMDFPAAWCDAFVDWIFYKCFGADNARKMLCGTFDDYTVNSAAMYKKKGRYSKTPEYGAQIFFRNSSGICHTGIVESVSNAGSITTIEGNKGNQVKRCTYSQGDSSIDGYGIPDWSVVAETEASSYGSGALTASSSAVNTISGTAAPSTKKVYEGIVSTRSSVLNVRKHPGVTAAKCETFGPIPKGASVEVCDAILDVVGDTWYFVRYQGKYGYVSAEYIRRA